MKISLRLSLFIVIFSMLSSFASAAVWSGGGGDDLASNHFNWTKNVLPQFGDDVIFDNTSTTNCTWDLNESVFSLSTEGDYPGSITVTSTLILGPPPTLTVNLGTNSRLDAFEPGQVRLYTFTILPGSTFKNITVGADSQNQHGNVDVLLAKNSMDSISTWYTTALNSYESGATYWTMNYFASYSSGAIPVWARMTTSSVGQTVVISLSTADGKGTVAAIPGTYYVMMKNEHPTDTAYIFVYVNGGY